MNGFLDVLNVGAGHLTFRFDKNRDEEKAKAKKVITDMLKRGYMIFVLDGGEQKRVRAFDEAHEEYILEEPDVIPEAPEVTDQKPEVRRLARRGKRVALTAARATGIGPTAGG